MGARADEFSARIGQDPNDGRLRLRVRNGIAIKVIFKRYLDVCQWRLDIRAMQAC